MLYLRTQFALWFLLAAWMLPQSGWSQRSIGELYATDASVKGSVILAGSGTTVLSGSQIAAGARTATLKLERGGSVLVCPGTSLSVASSQSGRQLLFSVNSGNLELDYPIGSNSDTLLTPDFRLMLPGPGQIHVAVRISANGDTCVQSLPSDNSALIVSEAMGDESYQVKPEAAVLFKGGHVQGAAPARQSCGCPAPPPTQVAKVTPPAPVVPTPPPPTSGAALAAALDNGLPLAPGLDPQPPDVAGLHLQVDAPFVFHGNSTPPALTDIVAHLKLDSSHPLQLQPAVLPPTRQTEKAARKQQQPTMAAAKPVEDHTVFGKIGAFFASIFR
jgi:hypothetical protein